LITDLVLQSRFKEREALRVQMPVVCNSWVSNSKVVIADNDLKDAVFAVVILRED